MTAQSPHGSASECVLCHGAPGVERTEWEKGMRPMPPPLAEEATHWSSAELFWIVRHVQDDGDARHRRHS